METQKAVFTMVNGEEININTLPYQSEEEFYEAISTKQGRFIRFGKRLINLDNVIDVSLELQDSYANQPVDLSHVLNDIKLEDDNEK
ncbi:hypothetical protein FOC89_00180 (plasmid) [Bacillus thuringiensis]|uniref:Uncharacterized protein n=1 Tax=Bacillus thuringiensis TaxID=1428 RepID=A0A0B5WWL2_BACTU|nr:hypothetical protein [Bacillus thuringiensis]AJG73671.1 hypothetical protein BF38_6113 [Bacillus thuringiensis]AJH80305.1 hypothetical protein BF36_5426 [Bacillus thuringiensis]EEM74682.1 hypothetical protein bthur0010_52960 [Bacillus thuringiensis serovar pondicheriensis BGSC 4BA1]OTX59400.1 hypothetical protein BK723_04280 [Bacillus thuringiensis serovar pondicheriensis]QKH22436.1 hypothetical protein FOC89_00180 [Bacillus thuringiensis]